MNKLLSYLLFGLIISHQINMLNCNDISDKTNVEYQSPTGMETKIISFL